MLQQRRRRKRNWLGQSVRRSDDGIARQELQWNHQKRTSQDHVEKRSGARSLDKTELPGMEWSVEMRSRYKGVSHKSQVKFCFGHLLLLFILSK